MEKKRDAVKQMKETKVFTYKSQTDIMHTCSSWPAAIHTDD